MADEILEEFIFVEDLRDIIWMYIGNFDELYNIDVFKSHCVLKLYCDKLLTDEDIEDIINLKYLSCEINTNITDMSIMNFNKLETLYCYDNNNITDKSIIKLTKLKILCCDNNDIITDESVGYLKHLNYLSCNETLTDICLQNLNNLTSLSLACNQKITDKGICYLKNLVELKCEMNYNITENILNHLPKLRKISIREENDFSDPNLKDKYPDLCIIHDWIK
jgi:hypothetical protein